MPFHLALALVKWDDTQFFKTNYYFPANVGPAGNLSDTRNA